jgi:hypothetical protein
MQKKKRSETPLEEPKIENETLTGKYSSPAGHDYSPIASINDVMGREKEIWSGVDKDLVEDVDLNTKGQLALIKELSKYYPEMPFEEEKKENLRYFFNNGWFCHSDAIMLYSIMRHYKPKKIVEVGSGVSSAAMLDTRDLFLSDELSLTFIEPFPDRLYTMISEEDKKKSKIIPTILQLADITLFDQLEENDILFIDSSHVSKVGSDVNYIFFDILPRLKSGVIIHFHDIFYPFEYPKDWVYGGRNWNECYMLRALLMNNTDYQIMLFVEYLHIHHYNAFAKMPLCYNNRGCSFWMRKL